MRALTWKYTYFSDTLEKFTDMNPNLKTEELGLYFLNLLNQYIYDSSSGKKEEEEVLKPLHESLIVRWV